MNKDILRLAIPNIISNITIPLLGAVDLAMMGHLDNIIFMGAIALGAMVFNFMYWGLGFLRMGTCAFTAQAFGAKDKAEIIHTLVRGLIIAICGASLLLLLQQPILEFVYLWIKPEEHLKEVTSSYFNIRIWGAPAAISTFVFSGWFIGMQDTKTPMFVAIAVNIFNIIFNYVCVFVLNMTSDGLALGTVLAQYAGLVLYVTTILIRHKSLLSEIRAKSLKNIKIMLHFLNVNSHIFIRTLLIISVFSFFTAESTHFGNNILVLNTVLYQFFIFFSYAMDGFAHAAEAINGKFVGSGEHNKKLKSIKYIFAWGLGMTLAFSLAYFFGFQLFISLFTKDSNILLMAKDYIWWIIAITIFGFPAFLWDGIYAGSLATKAMLYTMVIAVIGFFGFYYGFNNIIGNHSLWLAMFMFLFLRSLSMSIVAKKSLSL